MKARLLELSRVTLAIGHIQYFLPHERVDDGIEVYLAGRDTPIRHI